MAILDLSKLHMYRFHYDYIKPNYGEKAKLLMTDTDSLFYKIDTKDFYEDMKADGERYDMSNFDCDLTKHYKNNTNKKLWVLLKMKGTDKYGPNCIQSQASKDQQQMATFNCIRSKKHQLSSYEITKVGLCCYDNKRHILDDGVTSLSYGHYKI